MQIDSKELASLAAAAAPRFDMYAGIHKALRAFMADTLLAVGRMDSDDDLELARTTDRVLDLLRCCLGHLEHENRFVHTAIETRAPGASALVAHDHHEHVEHIVKLTDIVGALRTCAREERFGTAARLYRELALFVADNFKHMHVEETAHNAVLWARYTDAELVAVHDALVASIPAEEMMLIARWLVPAMNPPERAAVVGDMKAKAPPPAFDAILAVAQPHMTPGEWAKLARAVGIAAVPGLVAA